jgi:membrane-associated phospholipid phosphatase
MKKNIARFISILGHPALLMPLAAAIASGANDDHNLRLLSVIIAMLSAALVFTYSQVKASTGHWKHVDASIKSERKELNLTASITLFAGAVILALLKVHVGIVFAMALSGVILMASHFFSSVAKPSLHVGFAIFSACLTWPNEIAFVVLLLLAVFIGWARLCLERHTSRDLAVGAGLGFFAGFCFQAMVRWL